MKIAPPVLPPASPRVSPAGRVVAIVYLVLFGLVTLLLAIVTLLLLLGLIIDSSEFSRQIPTILVGLVATVGGGLYIYRGVRRLVRRN